MKKEWNQMGHRTFVEEAGKAWELRRTELEKESAATRAFMTDWQACWSEDAAVVQWAKEAGDYSFATGEMLPPPNPSWVERERKLNIERSDPEKGDWWQEAMNLPCINTGLIELPIATNDMTSYLRERQTLIEHFGRRLTQIQNELNDSAAWIQSKAGEYRRQHEKEKQEKERLAAEEESRLERIRAAEAQREVACRRMWSVLCPTQSFDLGRAANLYRTWEAYSDRSENPGPMARTVQIHRGYPRSSVCYDCGEPVSSESELQCVPCGWLICYCGACGCGYG